LINEARDLIDLLSTSVDLRNEGKRIRQFMLRVCEGITAVTNDAYVQILETGRQCVNGNCTPQAVKEARIHAVRERDRNRLIAAPMEAAFRTVRYLLELPEVPVSDWYAVLWSFIADAEQAGFSDEAFARLLKDTFPELESPSNGVEGD
jgi:hypothetical protein